MSFTKLDLLMMGDRDNLLSPDEFQKQLDDIVEEIDNLSGPQEPNLEPQVASGSKPLLKEPRRSLALCRWVIPSNLT